ncbi:MAG: hypothetical protein ILP12_03100 [Lachnospiraceae bacterium]|nr:hypothetical protein [Lachnospiraceae bacterium]
MKRLTLFCGHYGSGKTNLAVNYALWLRRQGKPAAIADIDIVNPYFRTKDSQAELEQAGVRVVALPFANTNVDLPALPPEVYALVQSRTDCAVFDVGGDDRGALALGRYVPSILEENDFDMLYVVNFYRPLTRTPAQALAVLREIEAACGIPFTGIVNNSNLAEETDVSVIDATRPLAAQLGALADLPVVMTAADERLGLPDVFPLRLQKKLV